MEDGWLWQDGVLKGHLFQELLHGENNLSASLHAPVILYAFRGRVLREHLLHCPSAAKGLEWLSALEEAMEPQGISCEVRDVGSQLSRKEAYPMPHDAVIFAAALPPKLCPRGARLRSAEASAIGRCVLHSARCHELEAVRLQPMEPRSLLDASAGHRSSAPGKRDQLTGHRQAGPTQGSTP